MCKKRISFLFFLLLMFSGQLALSQCFPGYYEYLDQNQVKARMNNGSDHFWDLKGSPGYEVPVGSDKHSAFASSIWIGGLDGSNTLHVAANTYRQSGNDFFAGPYRTGGNYVCDRGFSAPGNIDERDLLTISSGKVIAFYSNGFSVYDPTTNTTSTYVLPVLRNFYDAIELPDGRILLYGDDTYPTVSDAMVVDTANFTTQTIGQLNHFHKSSSATILPTAKS